MWKNGFSFVGSLTASFCRSPTRIHLPYPKRGMYIYCWRIHVIIGNTILWCKPLQSQSNNYDFNAWTEGWRNRETNGKRTNTPEDMLVLECSTCQLWGSQHILERRITIGSDTESRTCSSLSAKRTQQLKMLEEVFLEDSLLSGSAQNEISQVIEKLKGGMRCLYAFEDLERM